MMINHTHYDRLLVSNLGDTWLVSHPIFSGRLMIVIDGYVYTLTAVGSLYHINGVDSDLPTAFTGDLVDILDSDRYNALLSKIEDSLEISIEEFTFNEFRYK